MEYIKSKLSDDLARKIIGSQEKATEYLLRLNEIKPIPALKFKTISRGQNAGKKVLILDTRELWKAIVDSWNYEESKKIIRDIFKETEKYKSGKEADNAMDVLIKEWQSLKLGDIAWPFSQGAFDEFVQRINSENSTGIVKDDKVKKSPTNEFKRHFKDEWRKIEIKKPELVAEYLYKYQDEGRFGADPRLLVVYIDEDVSIDKIREIINKTDLNNPLEINFAYKHKVQGEKNYKVPCFVILLHN